ncbi:MAG: type VI secretion system tube protein Hcp [Polyangia bacterium]|jgi:type VI secretion system secreted protein Hcp|uniref:Hcp family type VI secretion system effector n=1 Tax=unclassified Thauera TaxID=2609274 RepID=UPI002A49CC5F|nr:type VI secretion system tube protein Hcp [Polyangia bacterium]
MASLQDFFIKIAGIDGESKDSKHTGWIDVLSFGYGVSQSSSMFTGGGGGVGKASFDTLNFVHYVDKATPNLMQYCASGKHVGTVEVSCCKVGDGSQEYMRVTMTDCIITHAGPSGSTSDARVTESVGISYSKIKVEVKEQNADGSMGAAVTGTWDVKKNMV